MSDGIAEYGVSSTAILDVKDSVAAKTTAGDGNQTLSGTTGTIDGIAKSAGQRCLLTEQSTGSQNGIWVQAAGAWTRPTDFATGTSVAGCIVTVEQGTVYAESGWTCTNNVGSDIVDTDALTFAAFGGYAAGDGLSLTNITFAVDLHATPGLEFSGAKVRVKAASGLEIGADGLKLDLTPNGGLAFTSGDVGMDLNDLSQIAAVDVANDSFTMLDNTDSSTKVGSIASVATGMAGDGIAAASGVFAVDLHATPGLEFSGNKLRVKAASGLEIGADGLKLDLTANGGLGFTSGDIGVDLNDLSAAVVAVAADSIAIIDANDSNLTRKESIVDLVTGMTGSGMSASAGVFGINLNGVSAAVIDVSADSFAFIDAGSSNVTVKESIADLATLQAGDGISATSGVFAVDLASGSPGMAMSGAKLTGRASCGLELLATGFAVDLTTNGGLKFTTGDLGMDLNDLAAATVDVAADSIGILDADDSSSKKESIADLAAFQASTGITATAGAFSVDQTFSPTWTGAHDFQSTFTASSGTFYGDMTIQGATYASGAFHVQPSVDAVNVISFNASDGSPLLSIDTTNKRVGIGTAAPEWEFHVYNDPSVILAEDPNSASSIKMKNSTSPATINTNMGLFDFLGLDGGDNETIYGRVIGRSGSSVADGTEEGELQFQVMDTGTLTTKLTLKEDGTLTLVGPLDTDSAQTVNRTAVTASTTTSSDSYYFGCDTVGADTITLQTADTVAGRVIIVKDEGGNANAQNITVDTQGGELIDGNADYTLNADYESVTLVCDGTNWGVN